MTYVASIFCIVCGVDGADSMNGKSKHTLLAIHNNPFMNLLLDK